MILILCYDNIVTLVIMDVYILIFFGMWIKEEVAQRKRQDTCLFKTFRNALLQDV